MYFKTKTPDVAQNLIDDFLSYLDCQRWLSQDLSTEKISSEKNIWGYGVNFWKNGSFVCET